MPSPFSATVTQRTATRIESRHNARWKELRHRLLHPGRAEDGRIAVEGVHLIEEALRSGLELEQVFVREDVAETMQKFPAREVCIVAASIFNHGSATETPQGVAALVQMPVIARDAIFESANPLLVVLDGVQDPGNLGTIVRSAEAFGATGLLLLPGTVSPWNQKTLRASAGSVFRVPLAQLPVEEALAALHARGIAICAAVAHGGVDVDTLPLQQPTALLIGNEGAGISVAALAQAHHRVQIPCPGPVESLNAAVATSILLYAAARQRMAPTSTQAALP